MPGLSLIVPVTGDEAHRPALRQAIALAGEIGGHLRAVHVRMDPLHIIPVIGEGLTAQAVQEIQSTAERESLERAEAARRQLEKDAEDAGLEKESDAGKAGYSWYEEVGIFSERMARLARVADLAVMSPKRGEDSQVGEDLFLQVLYTSGRPILMVPNGKAKHFGRILVAWNGSAESARAVAASLPLLERAEAVQVYTAGEIANDRPSLEELKPYLAIHGIKAEAREEEAKGGPDGQQIMDAAKAFGADMIVIGAYSHSRWREMVLGGATRRLINKSELPVFMSH